MKFEHLIEINDFSNPLAQVLSRAQVWRGLVLRASQPKLFIPYLDTAIVTRHRDDYLTRSLQYGELLVKDSVELDAENMVRYQVPAQGEISASSLEMRIEEPQPNALFVRCIYEDGHTPAEDAENVQFDEYRKSAYAEADIDMIRIVREMAEAGQL